MIAQKRNKKKERTISTLLTTSEVARIFDVHASTVRRWSKQGKIKTYPKGTGEKRGFRREDVAALYLDRAIQKYLKDKSA